MTAATVRPAARPEKFLAAAPLQEQFALFIEDEYRKRTVQYAAALMAFAFCFITDNVILLVDYNQFVIGKRDYFILVHFIGEV
jgi:hypothetical protein